MKWMDGNVSHRQSRNLLPALHVPQPGGGVHTARGHQGALWAERQADLHGSRRRGQDLAVNDS